MALSNAEKVKRYRERQKEKKQDELKQPPPPSTVFKKPFFEFFPVDQQLGAACTQSLELAGMTPVLFEDDSGPEASTLDDLNDGFEDTGASNPFAKSKGSSLGKAEVLIGCLLDAASDLAGWVSDYKKSEILARIAEIEASDLSDPEARRAAFEKVAILKSAYADFDKSIRWTMPQWKADIDPALLTDQN